MNKLSISFCCCLSLFYGPVAWSQTESLVGNAPMNWDLERVLDQALNRSPAIQLLKKELEVSEGQVLQSGKKINPNLETEVENISGTGPYEGLDSAEVTVSISQVLESNGKREKRKLVASLEKESVHAELQLLQMELRSETKQAFSDLLLAREQVALMEGQVALAQTSLQETKRLAEAARSSQLDVQRALLAVGEQEFSLEQARSEVQTAKIRLAVILGEPENLNFSITGDLEIPEELSVLNFYRKQIAENPRLQRFAGIRDQQRARLDLEKSLAKGDVEVFGGLRYSNEEDGDVSVLVGVGIPLPLFDKNEGNIRSAEAEVEKVELQVAAAHWNLSAEISDAYAEMSAAHMKLQLLKNSLLPLATATVSETEHAYERGQLSLLSVLESRGALFEMRKNHLEALQQFVSAQNQIDFLTSAFSTTH